jgi:hypothetical protein
MASRGAVGSEQQQRRADGWEPVIEQPAAVAPRSDEQPVALGDEFQAAAVHTPPRGSARPKVAVPNYGDVFKAEWKGLVVAVKVQSKTRSRTAGKNTTQIRELASGAADSEAAGASGAADSEGIPITTIPDAEIRALAERRGPGR